MVKVLDPVFVTAVTVCARVCFTRSFPKLKNVVLSDALGGA